MGKQEIIQEALKIDGLINEQELSFIWDLIEKYNCRSVLETGTFKGRTTYMIAKQLENKGFIHTIDCYGMGGEARPEYAGYNLDITKENLKDCSNVTILNSLSTSDEIRDKINKQYDLVILDGDHTLPVVRQELANFGKLTSHIIGHDYGMSDVFTAVTEYCSINNLSPIRHEVGYIFFEINKNDN